jgi:hypothetical protein
MRTSRYPSALSAQEVWANRWRSILRRRVRTSWCGIAHAPRRCRWKPQGRKSRATLATCSLEPGQFFSCWSTVTQSTVFWSAVHRSLPSGCETERLSIWAPPRQDTREFWNRTCEGRGVNMSRRPFRVLASRQKRAACRNIGRRRECGREHSCPARTDMPLHGGVRNRA